MNITKVPYHIETVQLLKNSEDDAIKKLEDMINNGTIWFPWQKLNNNAETLFKNLQNKNAAILRPNGYRLYSYYPKYNLYLPPLFRSQYIIVDSSMLMKDVDILSDMFLEDIRLESKKSGQEFSVLECWDDKDCLKTILKKSLEYDTINPDTMREAIYNTIAEATIFKPSWAKALLKLVMGDPKGKSWLDISAGWGDRLLTAMALDMNYLGFDPNIRLKERHDLMIKQFGNGNQKIVYEPFENGVIDQTFDVILSSPPFFDIEIYAPGQKGQSIESYPSYGQWMAQFLFASLNKAWSHLKEDGYLILHLGDSKTIHMAEATNLYIESFLINSSWEGVIGLQSYSKYPRPVWVWKKVSKNRKLWSGNNSLSYYKRRLIDTYPDLMREIINGNAASISNYNELRSKGDKIRLDVGVLMVDVPQIQIDSILSDDLMVQTVVKKDYALGVKWLSDQVRLALSR